MKILTLVLAAMLSGCNLYGAIGMHDIKEDGGNLNEGHTVATIRAEQPLADNFGAYIEHTSVLLANDKGKGLNHAGFYIRINLDHARDNFNGDE